MHSRIVIEAIVALLLQPCICHAAFNFSDGDKPPKLLVLNVATDPEGQEIEERFVSELDFVLEGVSLVRVTPEQGDFLDKSLKSQIEIIRPLILEYETVAATWMDQLTEDSLILYMVAVSSGRALAKLVESRPVSGFEQDLAIAARELLGTAFLFHDLPAETHMEVEAVVKSVREEVAAPIIETQTREPPQPTQPIQPPQPEKKDARDLRSVFVSPLFKWGLAGYEGPSLMLGGVVGLDRIFAGELRGRWSTRVSKGYLDKGGDDVSSWLIESGLGLLYLFGNEHVAFGPGLELSLFLFRIDTNIDGRAENSTEYSFGLTGHLEFRIHLSETLDLVTAGALCGIAERERYRKAADGHVVVTTPFMISETRVGLSYSF